MTVTMQNLPKPRKPGAGRKKVGTGLRGGKLSARPIMVYPGSPEEREAIVEAANAEGRSVSNFMILCADFYLKAVAVARAEKRTFVDPTVTMSEIEEGDSDAGREATTGS